MLARLLRCWTNLSGLAARTPGHRRKRLPSRPIRLETLEERCVPALTQFQFETALLTAQETDGSLTVNVVRTGDPVAATIDYSTANGTATAGSDFTATAGTLTFAAEETFKTITIPILMDATLAEGTETFSLTLSNPTGGATLGVVSTTLVTIGDLGPGELGFAFGSVRRVSENDGKIQFGVFRNTTVGAVTVNYTTIDGTAKAGEDYTAVSGTLHFAAGAFGPEEGQIEVPILRDSVYEGLETFDIVLSDPTGGAILGADSRANIVLEDLSFGQFGFLFNYDVKEGDDKVQVGIYRSNGSTGEVTVHYATANGTATAGSDYTATSGTLTFLSNEIGHTIEIPIARDGIYEGSEFFNFFLSEPTGGAQLGPDHVIQITINDLFFNRPEFIFDHVTVDEQSGLATISVFRDGPRFPPGGDVTVDYATSDGTAMAGQDYVATSGTLTFAFNENGVSFTVPLLDDALLEGDEFFNLTLSNPTGGAFLGANSTIVVHIRENEFQDGDIGFDLFPQFTTSFLHFEESQGSATFDVRRTASGPGPVPAASVAFATSDGTATAGQDYTPVSGVLNWGENEGGVRTITIPVTRDNIPGEDLETVYITLTSPSGGTLRLSNKAVLGITDSGIGHAEFDFDEFRVTEIDGTATITVVRSNSFGAASAAFTVDYAASNGTATAGADYTAVSGTLSFGPGESSRTFTIPIQRDNIPNEGIETVLLTLSNPTGSAGLDTPITALLSIDDTLLGEVQFEVLEFRVDEAVGNAVITVQHQSPTGSGSGEVSIDYATSNGTATAGSDYTPVSGTLTFSPGDSFKKTFTIPILRDSLLNEGLETIILTLSNPTGGVALGRPSQAVLTIDDTVFGQLEFDADHYSVNEADGTATITVRRVGGTGQHPVSVDFATSNGTATAGADYTAMSGTLTFEVGVSARAITIPLQVDGLYEGAETIHVTLSNPTGGAGLSFPSTAVVTITDNAVPQPLPSVVQFGSASATVAEPEGTVSLVVTRIPGTSSSPVSVKVTVSGTATSGSDYVALPTEVGFAQGETSKTLTIQVKGDSLVEGNETLVLTLSDPTGLVVLGTPTVATITIVDHQEPPRPQPGVFQTGLATVTFKEDAGMAALTIVRNGGSDGTVTVDYVLAAATNLVLKAQATPDKDYHGPFAGTLTFAAGVVQQTLSVGLLNDDLVEDTEFFTLTLLNPMGGATLGSQVRTTVEIVDNDLPKVESFTPPLPRLQLAGAGFGKSEEHYRDFVSKAYARFLGRQPDAQGFTYWVSLMQLYETSKHAQGLRQEQIEAGFLDSAEYKGRYGGIGEAWLRGIYQDLLHRTADPDGLRFWLDALARGATPTDVAQGFTASEERLRNRVAETYRSLLEREPDTAGLAYWVAVFKQGGTTEDINSGFVGSPEYYAKVTGSDSNPAQWVRDAYLDILFRPAARAELDYWLSFLKG